MREPSYFTHEEYALTKVALAREEVPAEAFALLSAWIEGGRLLVDEREEGRDHLLPHGFKGHGAAPSHRRFFVRPPSLQAQSWPLPQVEWLLSAPVSGCGGGLAAGADTEGLSRHSVCPGVRGENQGDRKDQEVADPCRSTIP